VTTASSARRRRLIALAAVLTLLIILLGALVVAPYWNARRLAAASTKYLQQQCAEDVNIFACSILTRKSIGARRTEQAWEPLEIAWRKVESGAAAVTPQRKAELAGSIALAYMLSGRTEEAPRFFTRASDLDAGNVNARLAAAFWLSAEERYSDAMRELELITKLDPKDDLAWFLMAHVYNENNLVQKGREAAQRAVSLNPGFPSYWQELGDSYAYEGVYPDALKHYREALRLDPESTTAKADVARVSALVATRPDEYADALNRVTEVIKNDPLDAPSGYALLGELHMKFGKYALARDALKQAIKSDETIPEPYYRLSQALRLSGDVPGAEKVLARYNEMNRHFHRIQTLRKKLGETPRDPQLHLDLAREWEYYKAWTQAVSHYQEVLRLQPANLVAAKRLGQLEQLRQEGKLTTPYNWVLVKILRSTRENPLKHRMGSGPAGSSMAGGQG
jgi:tetratricopeptide (TPR) repeat protein